MNIKELSIWLVETDLGRETAPEWIIEQKLREMDELVEATNRIAELEAELESLKNDPMTKQHYNQIKAEGIRKYIKDTMTEGTTRYKAGMLYADNLEKNDETH